MIRSAGELPHFLGGGADRENARKASFVAGPDSSKIDPTLVGKLMKLYAPAPRKIYNKRSIISPSAEMPCGETLKWWPIGADAETGALVCYGVLKNGIVLMTKALKQCYHRIDSTKPARGWL